MTDIEEKGREIADILFKWRPTMDVEEIGAALVVAIECYSEEHAGNTRYNRRVCFEALSRRVGAALTLPDL